MARVKYSQKRIRNSLKAPERRYSKRLNVKVVGTSKKVHLKSKIAHDFSDDSSRSTLPACSPVKNTAGFEDDSSRSTLPTCSPPKNTDEFEDDSSRSTIPTCSSPKNIDEVEGAKSLSKKMQIPQFKIAKSSTTPKIGNNDHQVTLSLKPLSPIRKSTRLASSPLKPFSPVRKSTRTRFKRIAKRSSSSNSSSDDDSDWKVNSKFSLSLERGRRNSAYSSCSHVEENIFASCTKDYSSDSDESSDSEGMTMFRLPAACGKKRSFSKQIINKYPRLDHAAKSTSENDDDSKDDLPFSSFKKKKSCNKIVFTSDSEDSIVMDSTNDDCSDSAVQHRKIKPSKNIKQVHRQKNVTSKIKNVSCNEEIRSVKVPETSVINKSKLYSGYSSNKSKREKLISPLCAPTPLNINNLMVTLSLPGEDAVRVPVKQMRATLNMSPKVVIKDVFNQFLLQMRTA